MPTPADEHQGHAKCDLRFSREELAGRPLQHGALEEGQRERRPQLPGTGFIWDNNVDTSTARSRPSSRSRLLNEVRGQYSRYTDRRAAKCDCVSIQRAGLLDRPAATTTGTWGVLPEETYDLSDTLSMWTGNHSMKTGGSFTYDVTEQLYQPLQNGVYVFAGAPAVAPDPFQYQQSFALVPEAG